MHVTTKRQPAAPPTYTVDDTAGATPNAATIRLPVIGTVITAPPLGTSAAGAVPWPVTRSTCDVDGCSSTIDVTSHVRTSNPQATIDGSTLDVDPSTPGVHQTFTARGETIPFDGMGTAQAAQYQFGVCDVSNAHAAQGVPYEVLM